MVTYCSKTNASEPTFTTIIKQSEKKKNSECPAELRKNLQALKSFRTPGLKEKCF